MDSYLWKEDKFDSGVLGFRVAKILNLSSKKISKLIGDLKKNKIEYATIRIQANDYMLVHALEANGFILVDGLITLTLKTSDYMFVKQDENIRIAKKQDLGNLKKMTHGLYPTSRIMNDSLIPKRKANEYYIKWIENSLFGKAADTVLVWIEQNKVGGYITLKNDGQISLVGVSKVHQGKGISKKLLNAAMLKFKEWKIENVVIETQVDNIPALRAYQGAGFKIIDSHLTFRWSDLD